MWTIIYLHNFSGTCTFFKGALVEIQTQNFYIYKINEVIRQTWNIYFANNCINKLFLEKNKQHKGEGELHLSTSVMLLCNTDLKRNFRMTWDKFRLELKQSQKLSYVTLLLNPVVNTSVSCLYFEPH